MKNTRNSLTIAFFLALTFQAAVAARDLGVRYISRAPLYWRYNVVYPNGIPVLASTHNGLPPENDQHWPNPGESITFTAHIRNHGDTAVTGFQYRWQLDGVNQGSGPLTYASTVNPGATVTVAFQWTWPANLNDHTITLIVDPNSLIADPYRQNNTYTDYTNGLSFSIWVEQGLYDRFNQRLNGFGTYSFDDWFRWQFDEMKASFARSIYPDVAPNGILERIRVEEINVIPFDPNNLNNWQQYLNNDPHIMLNDGRWQFTSGAGTLAQKQADWDSYWDYAGTTIDWGLIHEMAHQLGVIDEYRMNLPSHDANQALTMYGQPLRAMHLFHRGGVMGGGYVLPSYTDGIYFDSHSAGYLNRNLHYRRGYFGDYLFDTPQTNLLEVTDVNGAPLANATVRGYQKDLYSEYIWNSPVFTAQTDANGIATLPNRSVPANNWTATGHRLTPNPFGQINVVGVNGTMMLNISKDLQEDFRWFEIIQLNLAYWSGNTATAVYQIMTDILPLPPHGRIGTTNLALNRPATASSSANLAPYANNGDTENPSQAWAPNPTSAGQWWRVDLGSKAWISRAIVWGWAGNRHDWFSRFHLEASETGQFAGEQTIVPLEENWDETRGAGDYEMQRLSGLETHCVYTFMPVRGRYFRIVSDVTQWWVQLQEVELYAAEGYPGGDTNGDGCVDDSDMTNLIMDYDTPGGGHGATDVDGSGLVDDADLTQLILNYGMGC